VASFTLSQSEIAQTSIGFIHSMLKCKKPQTIVVTGTKGVEFVTINDKYQPSTPNKRHLYFQGKNVECAVEYETNKFIVSLCDKNRELVGLIDFYNGKHTIIPHPSKPICETH